MPNSTSVKLILPAIEANIPTSAMTPTGTPSRKIVRVRALLLENDWAAAEILMAQMKQLGCEIERASDGRTALDMFATRPPFDVVVTEF